MTPETISALLCIAVATICLLVLLAHNIGWLRRMPRPQTPPLIRRPGFEDVVYDKELSPPTYFGMYSDGFSSVRFYAPTYSSKVLECYRLEDGCPLGLGINEDFRNYLRHQEFVRRMNEVNRRQLMDAKALGFDPDTGERDA